MPSLSTDYVFMSYSRRDDAVMRRIVAFLREQGIKVWVDNEKLIPGTPVWEKEIEKAVQGASAVVVVLSPDSKDSEWVRREISLADQYEKRVFPLLVRGDEKTSISIRLIGRQYVDIRSNEDAGLNYVSATLLRYLEELNEREQNAKKEADRLAAQKIKTEKRLAARKAEEERIALEKVNAERKAKEEADRLSAQKAEEERIAFEKIAADRKAKEDADHLIAQKAELESKEKLAREKLERESRERLAREEAEVDAVKELTRSIKDRILEAAIQKQIIVDKPASLYVWIKQFDSKSIISVVKHDIDENVVLDENNVKSKGLEIEFPVEQGKIAKASISLKLVAPEFFPPTQQKEIKVPVNGDSEVCTFLVTPKKAGKLLINIEVLKDKVSVANRNLWTTAIETETKESSPMLLVTIPIIVVVQPKSDVVNINGNVSDSVIVSGDHNAVVKSKIEKHVVTKHKPNRQSGMKLLLWGIGLIAIAVLTLIFWRFFPFISSPNVAPALEVGSTEVSPKDGMTLLYVPAGEFTMGSDVNSDERPIHKITLDAYWIDQTEVTNAQYAKCVADNGACEEPTVKISSTRSSYYGNSEFDNYPVLYVDWNMANSYCSWAGRELPSEAQWEKAARGTDARVTGAGTYYPWGGTLDCSYTNYYDNIKGKYCVGDTTVVKNYESGKSFYGAYDMAGNVWEWVSSLYQPYPYDANDGRENLSSSGSRALRGGSWYFGENFVRSASRYKIEPTVTNYTLGFRCSRSP